jgi:hypothetical protein
MTGAFTDKFFITARPSHLIKYGTHDIFFYNCDDTSNPIGFKT